MANSAVLRLDDYSLEQFLPMALQYGSEAFGFVVTPNVDHAIRYYEDQKFRELYQQAQFVLCDSRILSRLLWLTRGLHPRVCPGSDLTAALLGRVDAADRVVMIGGSAAQAEQIRQRYGLRGLCHHNPPMGFVHDAQAREQCLRFIEAHSPFRLCFLGVGSPQQELVALGLKQRGIARGLALCVGASMNFLTGSESRAPHWMQRLSLEWLYRLLQDPRRMAWRYLVRGPRIFVLLPRIEIVLRR